ncbi:family 16 glycoside hydrolase [Candidatus Poribacteria bacterium]
MECLKSNIVGLGVLTLFILGFFHAGISIAGTAFEDDFSGNDDKWEVIEGNWKVKGGTYTEEAKTPYAIVLAGDENWTDYTVEVDVTLADNDAGAAGSHDCIGILFRADNEGKNGYRFWIRTDASGPGQFVKWIDKTWDQGGSLTPLPIAPIEIERVYHFKVVVEGNRIIGFIDDVEVVDYEDPDDSFQPKGKIGLITYIAKEPVFDNVIVYGEGFPVEPGGKLTTTWGKLKE